MKRKQNNLLGIFRFSALLTIILAGLTFWQLGWQGLWLFFVLLILEVTFSFDNAVVNSRTLASMSLIWQRIFLTVGIFIAVFAVRFLLPIVIVMFASGLNFGEVVNMALNNPERYGHVLHDASPIINAFGGIFLLMIGLSYFVDYNKQIHWVRGVEPWLARAGKFENFRACLILLVMVVLYFTVEEKYKAMILISSVLGTLLHIGLELFGSLFGSHSSKDIKLKTGWAAFAAFLYLEVLDASFSFDGVIGAFAITSSVILITSGLSAGAIWVRSLTIYLMRSGTLSKYRYLEHGAHWAIVALGIMMLFKLFHVELPEWITGSLGLAFIILAIGSSVIEARHSKNTKNLQSS